MIPSAPGTLRKRECKPFDEKCKRKLRTSAFFKQKKRKLKGTPPPAGTGTGGAKAAEAKPKEGGREFQYTVTYPSGETRLLREKRDTSMSLAEQIKKARKRALEKRAAENG